MAKKKILIETGSVDEVVEFKATMKLVQVCAKNSVRFEVPGIGLHTATLIFDQVTNSHTASHTQ